MCSNNFFGKETISQYNHFYLNRKLHKQSVISNYKDSKPMIIELNSDLVGVNNSLVQVNLS